MPTKIKEVEEKTAEIYLFTDDSKNYINIEELEEREEVQARQYIIAFNFNGHLMTTIA